MVTRRRLGIKHVDTGTKQVAALNRVDERLEVIGRTPGWC